jgi:hypothetical protein
MVSYAITPFQRARELHGGDTAFIGKWVRNARARREQKRADRQEFKLDKIEARGAARAVARSTRPGFLEGAGNLLNAVVPGLIGGGGDAAGAGVQEPMYMEPPRQNNSMLIIGVVVVIIAIVAVVVYMKKKK